MSSINKNIEKPMDECLCKRIPVHSCEVCVDSKIILNTQLKDHTKIIPHIKIKAKILKLCHGKLLIGGVLKKTIYYKDSSGLMCGSKENHVKSYEIPFTCFINVNCAKSKDSFEIVSSEFLCSSSIITNKEVNCSSFAILEEKDLIKITVRRKQCSNGDDFFKCRFCGKAAFSNEICFVPGVNPAEASISVKSDPKNFKVELVDFSLIVVCGFITKTVSFSNGKTSPLVKDIPIQISIPAAIDDLNELNPEKWIVSKVEICTGCHNFICPDSNGNFHKLIEKDIIAVEVSHLNH